MNELSGAFRDAFSGFAGDLKNGATATDALNKALGRLSDRLLDMAINQAWEAAFPKKNVGGGLLALLGFGSGTSGVVPGTEAAPGLQFHSGGIVGIGGSQRHVHPAYFDDAPRYHGGGIAGLAPDEVPAILQRGERIIPKGSAGGLTVQINNYQSGDTEVQSRREDGPNGERLVLDIVKKGIAGGEFDAANASRHGLRAKKVR
jgi:hypothetical protein